MKLVIPMAGRGTRVRPHSHVTPKPLLNVRGKSMIERLVDTFIRVLPGTIDEGVFILGPDFGQPVRDMLSQICDARGMKARFPVQETAQGTGHAVFAAREHLDGDGIVVFADTLFDMDPIDSLGDSDVVAWVKHVDDPSRFGVAVREGEKIVAFVEKPQKLISTEALIGIYYCKDLKQLRRALQHLVDNDIRGVGNEIQLTDAFDFLLKEDALITTAGVTEWLDCGTIPALMETTQIILDKEADQPGEGEIRNCVVHEPVFVARGAIISDSVVGPYVSVEAGAVISNSVVSRSIVFANAEVSDTSITDSLVGQSASVKPARAKINVGDHSTIE
ncbi:MAG: NTP transferase domain-containing protein [Bacteroidetes bacterium]|nr:NTP transferase domain-containing protein [Bacteroidota bacterium]